MRRAWPLATAAAGATIVLEVVFRHAAHPVAPWHALPAFDLGFGFLGCALIVLASKALGRAFLQRPEDFYGDGE